MEPLWHRMPASFGMSCDSYCVEGHDKRNSLYMFGLLVSCVPLSLLNVKMTDDGTKLCMSRIAEGIVNGPNGRYSGTSDCHLERIC